MLKYLVALIAGGLLSLTLAAPDTKSATHDPKSPEIEIENVNVDDVDPEAVLSCYVRVGYGFRTYTYRCTGDRVMVGLDGDALLCADITVDCF